MGNVAKKRFLIPECRIDRVNCDRLFNLSTIPVVVRGESSRKEGAREQTPPFPLRQSYELDKKAT